MCVFPHVRALYALLALFAHFTYMHAFCYALSFCAFIYALSCMRFLICAFCYALPESSHSVLITSHNGLVVVARVLSL